MTTLFGILGLFGFLVCFVLIIINLIKKKSIKHYAIGIAVCFVIFIICITITPSKPQEKTTADVKEVTETVVEEKAIETVVEEKVSEIEVAKTVDTTEAQQSEEVCKIVDDVVVNSFLSECNFDYGEIKKGNIRTKFFIHINNCYTELLNSNTEELVVTIKGYHINDINEPEVIEAFKMVAQTINGNSDDLDTMIDGLTNHNTDLYTGSVGDLEYQFYPFVELSKGVSESRIQIRTKKYNK